MVRNANSKEVQNLIVTMQVDLPPWMAQGIKEAIAMDLEKYGAVKVLEIEIPEPEQLQMKIKETKQ